MTPDDYIHEDFRLYTWQLFQLSPMQQGIQALHVLGELNAEYPMNTSSMSSTALKLYTYQKHHKTVVCLNGGNLGGLRAVWGVVSRYAPVLDLPCAFFNEDEQSLGGIMTACGVVVPKSVWELDPCSEVDPDADYATEMALATFLRQFPLAR